MNRLILVSNRLPVTATINQSGEIQMNNSAGGLATGLNSLELNFEKLWIGWSGAIQERPEDRQRITQALAPRDCIPVFLNKQQYSGYYEGFSNETIWPLFHYFNQYSLFENSYWETYQEVNRLFAEKIRENVQEGDLIWIHDYHLMLLPQLLRQQLPGHQIGFFLHIPFPSYEVYRICPWASEITEGLLGADLLGFHTFGYMHHFVESATKILNLKTESDYLNYHNRHVHLNAFPMGINADQFEKAMQSTGVQRHQNKLQQLFSDQKMVLTVDRLDYSKGIIHRLKAYEALLKQHAEFHEKVAMVMVVVPSRATIRDYRHLKEEIDEAVGKINSLYGTLGWTPVHYLYRSVPFEQLAALYHQADIALITPLRDGMNLVAKEYVASRTNDTGVLILSRMAGAACELESALDINPRDDQETMAAMLTAIHMPEEEQKARMKKMRKVVRTQTVQAWAVDFIETLQDIYLSEYRLKKQMANGAETIEIRRRYELASTKTLFLKYDGSLVPYSDDPASASPDSDLLQVLKVLSEQSQVVIVSGRDHQTLEQWFPWQSMDLISEYGMRCRINGHWHSIDLEETDWKKVIMPLLEEFTESTPGSFVEQKEHSLAWHFRKADPWLTELRLPKLMENLINRTTDLNLEVIGGDKALEIKPKGPDTQEILEYWLSPQAPEVILAIGDDMTDEALFAALPESALTIKVGKEDTVARYRFPDSEKVMELLVSLTQFSQSQPASPLLNAW